MFVSCKTIRIYEYCIGETWNTFSWERYGVLIDNKYLLHPIRLPKKLISGALQWRMRWEMKHTTSIYEIKINESGKGIELIGSTDLLNEKIKYKGKIISEYDIRISRN